MQPFPDRSRCVLNRLFQGTFPNDSHAPAEAVERFCMPPVAIDISLEFLHPELLVGSRGGCVTTTFVSMPETTVNEHHRPVLREHDIRDAGQLFDMKSIPKPLGKKNGTKCPFRPSVLSADARHHAAALWSGRYTHDAQELNTLVIPEKSRGED